MDWIAIGGIAGIVSFVLVLLSGARYVGRLDALTKRHETCPIIDVDKAIGILAARFDMLMKTIETTAPRSLIAPHTPRRDDLLRWMLDSSICKEDAKELLEDIETHLDEFKGDKLLAATLVLVRLKDKVNGWS